MKVTRQIDRLDDKWLIESSDANIFYESNMFCLTS